MAGAATTQCASVVGLTWSLLLRAQSRTKHRLHDYASGPAAQPLVTMAALQSCDTWDLVRACHRCNRLAGVDEAAMHDPPTLPAA